jgi:hypothetical protein
MRWHLTPELAVEFSAALLRVAPTPLLEEERDPFRRAHITDVPHPINIRRSESDSAFAAGYHPPNPPEIETTQRPEQWLTTQEADRLGDLSQVVDAPKVRG